MHRRAILSKLALRYVPASLRHFYQSGIVYVRRHLRYVSVTVLTDRRDVVAKCGAWKRNVINVGDTA